MTAVLAEGDSVAAQIGSNSWATGAPQGSSGCSATPSFPGPLRHFVSPLEQLLDDFIGDPGAVYQASSAWEQECGDIADAGAQLERLRTALARQIDGAAADAIDMALAQIATGAHSLANWTKVVSQALQLCVTIFETVRSLACEALGLLGDFASTIGDVIFGSWPWEIGKKMDAINGFADDVEDFVTACKAAADNALKAGRELVRLLTDLNRAVNPYHAEIERLIGRAVEMIPGGDPIPVGPGQSTGDFGAIYNTPTTPYPGSDLRFNESYDFGYSHSYDLGSSDLSTEELNAMFREEFGHLFLPSRVGDNTQLNMQLTEEGQTITTSLFGTAIPGVTTGDIVVQQIADDGFVIAAMEGHPEYPGEVAFRISNDNGQARLQVTGAYGDTIIGSHDLGLQVDSNPAYALISDQTIWADMQGRIRDKLNYG